MYMEHPKKMLILDILEVLRNHSDCEHPLNQKQIIEWLEKDYGMTADRKAVKRNLMDLVECGYDNISYDDTKKRAGAGGETETLYTNWYYEHDFSDAELRLLIDGVIFSRNIPRRQAGELIGRVERLGSSFFADRTGNITAAERDLPENKELFLTIEVLDEAIEKKRKVSFMYNDFGADKKMHPRCSGGRPREYIVNPYRIVAANGNYYLVCNYDKYDNLANYRIDMITGIRLLEAKAKPKNQVRGLEHGLDIPKHMAEHVYMFAGDSVRVTFRMENSRSLISQIIDWFGTDVRFSDTDKDELTVSVIVNRDAMRVWALQYARFVTVTEPQDLAQQIKQDLETALEKYESESMEE